jgi:hypothetical protein
MIVQPYYCCKITSHLSIIAVLWKAVAKIEKEVVLRRTVTKMCETATEEISLWNNCYAFPLLLGNTNQLVFLVEEPVSRSFGPVCCNLPVISTWID